MSLVETRSYRSRLLAVQAAPTLSDAIRCIPTHPTFVLLWMPLSVSGPDRGAGLSVTFCMTAALSCGARRCAPLRRPSWPAP